MSSHPLAEPVAAARPPVDLRRGAVLVALFALLGVLWFGGLELRGLFAPDEGRYAEVPREMLESGDWVTPRLNGIKYLEKPPLQYWATAAVFALFGEDEWTARLPTALAGLGGALVLAFAAARLGSRREGWLAGFILASSWGYFFAAQYITLDMTLTLWLTCAMAAFLLAQRAGIDARAERRWMLVAWGSMALAVLTKGLIGIVLPGLALAVYVVVARDAAVLRRLHLVPGLALFAAIAVPWFALAQARNPEFFQFFFIHEHFARYTLSGHDRAAPWWYFLPIVLVGTMPWTPLVIAALARRGRAREEPPTSRIDVDRFLLVWAATVVVFFSLSSSKLPPYVLPALPALALLTARRFASWDKTHAVSRAAIAAVLAAGLIAATLPFLSQWGKLARIVPMLPAAVPWLCMAVLALLIGAIVSWLFARAGGVRAAVVALATASIAFGQLLLVSAHVVDEGYSAERLTDLWLRSLLDSGAASKRGRLVDGLRLNDDAPFYSVGGFDHSLPFYLGRTVTLVEHKSELAPGIAAEPTKYVASIADFERAWREAPRAYAALPPDVFQRLSDDGLPMNVLARDTRRVIVARH